MDTRPTLLIVDDSKMCRTILVNLFTDLYNILEATDGEQALGILYDRQTEITVVILDLMMPQKNGYDVLDEMNEHPTLKMIPVIVSTSANDVSSEVKSLSSGAIYFISKPINPAIVMRRVQNIVKKQSLSLMLQQKLLNQLKEKDAKVEYLAKYDKLTGLFNRTAFCEKTNEVLQHNPNQKYILLSIDIERFKLINDLFGLEEGNRILQNIAGHLESYASGIGICGRIEANLFALILPYNDDTTRALQEYCLMFTAQLQIDFEIIICMGAYIIHDTSLPVEIMLDRATVALRMRKDSCTKQISFYDNDLHQLLIEEQEIASQMNSALEKGQFTIFLQPKCRLDTGKIIGAETLVRWFHPTIGTIPPHKFIPIFERNGFIMKLDAFVWEKTCEYIRHQIDDGQTPVPISVNVSRINLYSPNLCDKLSALIEKYDLPHDVLELEITERSYTDNPNQLLEVMTILQTRGFKVLMDDFGSGYSSLNMLKDIPVDILKIDLKFLSNIESNERSRSILASIVRMAKWLNMPVIAEGVETKYQVDFLLSIGCIMAQGYFFYPPMSLQSYEIIAKAQPILKPGSKIQENVSNIINVDEFWNPSAALNIIFNNSFGSFGIYELFSDNLEAIRVNENYFTLTGHSRDNFYEDSKQILDLIIEDDRQIVLHALAEARKKGQSEYVFRRKHSQKGIVLLKGKFTFLSANDNRYIYFIAISEKH